MTSLVRLFATALLLATALFSPERTFAANIIIPKPPELAANSYILIDAATGKVLVDYNSDLPLPPASLTKMMTGYIAAQQIEEGTISPNDQVHISVKAWKMGGSKMYIREGTKVSLQDLLRGVIIQSGNDASVALAEHIAGSEGAFVDMMNMHAQAMGLENTHFANATGWPAEEHYMSARDLSRLALAIIQQYPKHYGMYAEKYFTYNDIRQSNRNKLLWRDRSVDGMKTGHTEAAGYCLVASAKRNNMRLITVVMGTSSVERRATESQKLLTYGFRYFETHSLYAAGELIDTARVWSGLANNVKLGLAEEVTITIPRGKSKQLMAKLNIDELIKAPVRKGDKYGSVSISLHGEELYEGPVVALQTVERGGIFKRLMDFLHLFFLKLFS